MIARRIVVRGRVQGVFYRNWTVATANGLGVRGWVRNRHDGSVEILACGDEAAVEALVEACRRGPEAAQVEAVDVEGSAETCLDGFGKRPTC